MASKKLKYWFDKDLARLLADKIQEVKTSFEISDFVDTVHEKVEDLELKARVETIADELHKSLGGTYLQNLKILSKILGPENEEETGMFTNFYWIMPIAKFIEKYGLDHFDSSMKAIAEVTRRNTGEYTIRPFLEKYPAKTLKVMKKWAASSNFHERRLACEGVRPRLPWAKKLDSFIDDPTPILPILNMLKDDESKYVQKSVANCINDVLKDNPELAKTLLEKWSKKATPCCQWIIKHAVRNLRKKEDPWAQKLVSDLG